MLFINSQIIMKKKTFQHKSSRILNFNQRIKNRLLRRSNLYHRDEICRQKTERLNGYKANTKNDCKRKVFHFNVRVKIFDGLMYKWKLKSISWQNMKQCEDFSPFAALWNDRWGHDILFMHNSTKRLNSDVIFIANAMWLEERFTLN